MTSHLRRITLFLQTQSNAANIRRKAMIERIARAIACGIDAQQWDAMPESVCTIYLRNAEDALAEMRTAMLEPEAVERAAAALERATYDIEDVGFDNPMKAALAAAMEMKP
jgi:hypothetical protein